MKVSCPEEIAYHAGWIDADELDAIAKQCGKTEYSRYFVDLLVNA